MLQLYWPYTHETPYSQPHSSNLKLHTLPGCPPPISLVGQTPLSLPRSYYWRETFTISLSLSHQHCTSSMLSQPTSDLATLHHLLHSFTHSFWINFSWRNTVTLPPTALHLGNLKNKTKHSLWTNQELASCSFSNFTSSLHIAFTLAKPYHSPFNIFRILLLLYCALYLECLLSLFPSQNTIHLFKPWLNVTSSGTCPSSPVWSTLSFLWTPKVPQYETCYYFLFLIRL